LRQELNNTKPEFQSMLDESTHVKQTISEDNAWAETVSKQVNARLGLVASEMQTMQDTLLKLEMC